MYLEDEVHRDFGPDDDYPHPVPPQAFQIWRENWVFPAVDPDDDVRPSVAQFDRLGLEAAVPGPVEDEAGDLRLQRSRVLRVDGHKPPGQLNGLHTFPLVVLGVG